MKFDRNQFRAGLYFSCDFVGVRTRKHSHFSFLKSLHVICGTSKNRIDGGRFKTSDIWGAALKKKKKKEVSKSEAGSADVAAEFIFLLTATAPLCLYVLNVITATDQILLLCLFVGTDVK